MMRNITDGDSYHSGPICRGCPLGENENSILFSHCCVGFSIARPEPNLTDREDADSRYTWKENPTKLSLGPGSGGEGDRGVRDHS